ncbi:Uma2 family endonuclease [Larkinella sp. GY13]|uniref:Uma2 family endonuclease n=1 Tax=Larkinella sp. GY13 TaxID=3453720 RepID=UPI003EEA81CC
MEATIEQLSDYERERGKPMPTLNHSIVQGNLTFALQLHYRTKYTFLPEINLTMPERPDTVPDIAIYPKLQVDFLHDVTSMTQMPLTVIEIVSPSQSNDDILAKFERYFLAGVQSCWLVLPSFKAISVYSAIGKYQFFTDNTTLTDPVTGIELPLNDIFA